MNIRIIIIAIRPQTPRPDAIPIAVQIHAISLTRRVAIATIVIDPIAANFRRPRMNAGVEVIAIRAPRASRCETQITISIQVFAKLILFGVFRLPIRCPNGSSPNMTTAPISRSPRSAHNLIITGRHAFRSAPAPTESPRSKRTNALFWIDSTISGAPDRRSIRSNIRSSKTPTPPILS